MRKTKDNYGITLIALIITIIVLLILAGVTISMVVGDNGILNQAQNAKTRTDEESAKEEIYLEVSGSYDETGEINLATLNENLKRKGGVSFTTDEDITEDTEFVDLTDENQIEELPVTVKYREVEVEITGEYTGGPQKGKTASQLTPKDDYGQYVDYGLDLNGDGDTKNDWKIFYIGKDEDGKDRIFLIASDYVPNSNENLKSAITDKHAHMTKSDRSGYDICCISWYNASDAVYHCYDGRSELNHSSDKKQCSFPEIFMLDNASYKDNKNIKNHYYCSDHNGDFWINSRCASTLQCTENWSSFVKIDYADYAIGSPTIEMWVDSWNQKYGTELGLFIEDFESFDSGYSVKATNGEDKNFFYLSDYSGYNDTLYFPHHSSTNLKLFSDSKDFDNRDSGGECSSNGYWIASPDCSEAMYVMVLSCYGMLGNGIYNACGYDDRDEDPNDGYGVRPIISLKKDIRVEWVNDENANGENGYYKIVGAN